MKRLMLLAVLLSGCNPAPKPPEAEAALPDFVGWPTATPKPIPVEPLIAYDCRAPLPSEQAFLKGEEKRHGPHYAPAIVVRTNPEAMPSFLSGKPLPVGAVVVKEKHPHGTASGAPGEWAAMIKREAGYDPPNGDWEYLFVTERPERQVKRGKIESCAGCHAGQAATDHLFRGYLPR